jgi:hypothetical protein
VSHDGGGDAQVPLGAGPKQAPVAKLQYCPAGQAMLVGPPQAQPPSAATAAPAAAALHSLSYVVLSQPQTGCTTLAQELGLGLGLQKPSAVAVRQVESGSAQ